jgi:hypothetical protein
VNQYHINLISGGGLERDVGILGDISVYESMYDEINLYLYLCLCLC